jgi:hypothetical protein
LDDTFNAAFTTFLFSSCIYRHSTFPYMMIVVNFTVGFNGHITCVLLQRISILQSEFSYRGSTCYLRKSEGYTSTHGDRFQPSLTVYSSHLVLVQHPFAPIILPKNLPIYLSVPSKTRQQNEARTSTYIVKCCLNLIFSFPLLPGYNSGHDSGGIVSGGCASRAREIESKA